MIFSIYRYNPEAGLAPEMRRYELKGIAPGMMVRDALLAIRADIDPTLAFRHSCGEGVCGSDAVNINGRNALACITPLAGLKEPVEIRPLPGQPVIRDLVVEMELFFRHYRSVEPYLIRHDPLPETELLQSPAERERLDGLYECIQCGCCSTACPSYWWNPERFLGPAALLQACRFLADSRDQGADRRLAQLDDVYRLYRCHTIMNCTEVCPKGLNPASAIGAIRRLMVRERL